MRLKALALGLLGCLALSCRAQSGLSFGYDGKEQLTIGHYSFLTKRGVFHRPDLSLSLQGFVGKTSTPRCVGIAMTGAKRVGLFSVTAGVGPALYLREKMRVVVYAGVGLSF